MANGETNKRTKALFKVDGRGWKWNIRTCLLNSQAVTTPRTFLRDLRYLSSAQQRNFIVGSLFAFVAGLVSEELLLAANDVKFMHK